MAVFITLCILWLIYKFFSALGSVKTVTSTPASSTRMDAFDDENISRQTFKAIRTIVRAKALEFNASSFIVKKTFDEYGNKQYLISIQVDEENIHALNDSLEDIFGGIMDSMEVTRKDNDSINIMTMSNNKPIQQINISGDNYGSLSGDTFNNNYPSKDNDDKYTDFEDVTDEENTNDADAEIIAELTGIFFGNTAKASEFIKKVKNMKDTDICQYVKLLKKERIISDLSYKKDLWNVLHRYNIYKAGYRNWAGQVS